MAYLYNVNNAVTNFSLSLFDIVEDMITQGWRIFGSGDGLAAFENTGQTAGSSGTGSGGGYHVFTSGGTGALGMDNAVFNVSTSWLRMRAPATHVQPNLEYLWERSWRASLGSDSWGLRTSRNGTGFNSGGSATVRPVASDECALAGNQVPQATSADFRVWIPSGGSVNMHWAIGAAAENFAFLAWNLRQSDSGVWGVWGLDPVGSLPPGSSPPTTDDPDPYVHIVGHSSSSSSSFNGFDVATVNGFYWPAGGSAERIEDMVGANGPDRGCYATLGFGEAGPPAYAGHYRVAPIVGCQGGGAERWTQAVGPDLPSTRQVHLIGLPYMRFDVSNTINFYKGVGALLGHTLERAADTDDDGTTARFHRSGTSCPWPQGVGFIL